MCYSGRIVGDYRRYLREIGIEPAMDIHQFARLYEQRAAGAKLPTPKTLDDAFLATASEGLAPLRAAIKAAMLAEVGKLEGEIFSQRKRLADAERILSSGKPTKKAAEDKRIATDKVARALAKLGDLRRSEPREDDRRFYPGTWVPVLVAEGERYVLRPMRYQCRIEGKPANYDRRFPGTYNARRYSLGGFWKPLFGAQHGLVVLDSFYEHVELEGKNEILEFAPRTGSPMLVACLWSQWKDPSGQEPDLLSFAAVTDDPEPEVAAAGHDRTIINLRPDYVEAWLHPAERTVEELDAILGDPQHPFYEHRLAA